MFVTVDPHGMEKIFFEKFSNFMGGKYSLNNEKRTNF